MAHKGRVRQRVAFKTHARNTYDRAPPMIGLRNEEMVVSGSREATPVSGRLPAEKLERWIAEQYGPAH